MAARTGIRVPGTRTVGERLASAVADCLGKVGVSISARSGEILQPPAGPLRVGVAFSGGRDSTALLDTVCRVARSSARRGLVESVAALHVNHGISPHAAEWEEACRAFAASRDVALHVERVRVDRKGKGLEAAAREARYKALSAVALSLGLDVVLTAHHQDDRLETFLIQWIRGAGVDGLSGMPSVRGFGDGGTLLARPWLDIPRTWIEAWVAARKLAYVDDESNTDTALLRNLIRNDILPVLDKARPGYRQAAARSVALVSEASGVLHSVAEDDAASCTVAGDMPAISIGRLIALPVARQAMCLRSWISSHGLTPPSKATVAEALRQARVTHSDSALEIRLSGCEIRRIGANLVLRASTRPARGTTQVVRFTWDGEAEVPLPPWGGVLEFRKAAEDEDGFPGDLLRRGPLEARPRQGGEKIKLYRLRPSRNLKHLYQAAKVPFFERPSLPLLWCGRELIFASGLGAEVRMTARPGESDDRWVVSWRPDGHLFPA